MIRLHTTEIRETIDDIELPFDLLDSTQEISITLPEPLGCEVSTKLVVYPNVSGARSLLYDLLYAEVVQELYYAANYLAGAAGVLPPGEMRGGLYVTKLNKTRWSYSIGHRTVVSGRFENV